MLLRRSVDICITSRLFNHIVIYVVKWQFAVGIAHLLTVDTGVVRPGPRYTNDKESFKLEETFMLSVGDVVPSLTLPHIDGGEFDLDALRGKRALLFWWGSW